MRVTNLELEHFKPYSAASIGLRDGVTVIHGVNGSGKSSLLEAVFFALYGANALDGTLEDVVTNGESDSRIVLEFDHDDDQFRIERELKRSGDRVSTRTCVLEGPDVTIEGARDVRAFVTELLRMDAEAFINCAYVRQGEVNKLINATATERQDMIDDLLQLGVLEEYRSRAGQARLGVEDVLGNAEGALSSVTEQIEAKRRAEPYERLNEIETELAELDERIDHYEEQYESANRALEEAEETLSTHRERRERLEALEEAIADLRAEIEATETEREELRETIVDRRERMSELQDRIDSQRDTLGLDSASAAAIEAHETDRTDRREALIEDRNEARISNSGFENQADALEEKADRLESDAATLRADAETLQSEADALEERADERANRRRELLEERSDLLARFEGTPIEHGSADAVLEETQRARQELTERQASVSATIDALEADIEETERLLAAGHCPECGQPVEDSPHVHDLDDDRERLAELEGERESIADQIRDLDAEIETAQSLQEAESRIEEIDTTSELLSERIEEMRTDAAEKRETAETKLEAATERESEADAIANDAATKREQAREQTATIEKLQAEIERIEAELESVSQLATLRDRHGELEAEIESLRDRREELGSRNDERREWLQQRRTERDDLRDAVDEARIDAARERKTAAEAYIDRVTEELDALAADREALTSKRGGVEADIEQLESLEQRKSAIERRVDALSSLHAETTELESMYGELRSDLRRHNVETLERMLNETFELVYANDAYSHIELDGEYELSVFQKDGERLDPEQLSGGERALFNLSLRCAIYRLLSEGIDGTASTPPLILDEPTVFLDSGHVSRLVDLVGEMRGFGVAQIVIVSHDEELIAAADDLLTVEKDPTTNRSTVRHESAPALSTLQRVAE
ncbi:MAG: DNA double-strand break repair ATPase Rad50 [Halobacteriota archaeon]